MPLIPPEILDTVVYLYPDADSAARGERAGGSGCIVVIPVDPKETGERSVFGFMYVVTNSHVIREGKASALRLNTRDGGTGIVHETQDGWIHHPNGDDLAILPINLEYSTVKARGIAEGWFITKEKLAAHNIGPGDEAYLVGRFVNHEGKGQNLPAVRFGQISMLPIEPIRTPRGLLQEAFLVECRSLPGYSGSPVFVAPLPLSGLRRQQAPPMFLGIDMGHLKDESPVLDKSELRNNGRHVPIDDNWTVEANTGMSCVIPAWKVRDLLYIEELVKAREEVLSQWGSQNAAGPISF